MVARVCQNLLPISFVIAAFWWVNSERQGRNDAVDGEIDKKDLDIH